MKLDIHKFYPSVDQELMIKTLQRKFKDKRLMNLLSEIVWSTDRGLPIGNYTSQYFANFFMTGFDHWVKEVLKVKYYFRYCDDMVFLASTKEELWGILEKVREKLTELKLELKPNWQVFPVKARSIDFLGYRTYHTHCLVRKYIKKAFIDKVKNSKTNFEKAISAAAYWGMFTHANCRNLWFKYTEMKTFKDLEIHVKSRLSPEQVLDQLIEVNNISFTYKRGEKKLNIDATFEGRNVIIRTTGELLIEAAEQFLPENYPFETKIIKENNYYKFD